MNQCLRIRAPRLSLTMSQPAETIWKQQLQGFDPLGWVFRSCYSLVFYNFFSSVSQFLSPCKDVSFRWWFVGPNVPQFCLLLKPGSIWELVCESVQLLPLVQRNSCFSLSFKRIENFFSPTRVTYPSVSHVKSSNSIAHISWNFPKRLLAFISPDYRSRVSKKGWNFFFSVKKKIVRKKELFQIYSSSLLNGWYRSS